MCAEWDQKTEKERDEVREKESYHHPWIQWRPLLGARVLRWRAHNLALCNCVFYSLIVVHSHASWTLVWVLSRQFLTHVVVTCWARVAYWGGGLRDFPRSYKPRPQINFVWPPGHTGCVTRLALSEHGAVRPPTCPLCPCPPTSCCCGPSLLCRWYFSLLQSLRHWHTLTLSVPCKYLTYIHFYANRSTWDLN